MFTFYQTAIKTKVVQIAMNATYTTFYFDYQRYYTQKCRVQTKCCKSLYGGVHKRFLGQCVHTSNNTRITRWRNW